MNGAVRVLKFLTMFVAWTGFQSAVAQEVETPRPNIVLCMADDQGWGDVGYYDNSIAKTPVLDEMSSRGLRLDRFYAAAPVCSPTRGSVLTGRNPNRFGCFEWGHSLRPQEVTIAEALKQAGYTTGHFGKWHLGSVSPHSDVSPGASGFARWFSSPNFFDLDPLMSDQGRVVHTQGEGSEVTAAAAIEFIRSSAKDKQPFLAVVWFGSPHDPHVALDRDRQLYADQPEALQHYYGEITAMDRSIGMLRDELRRLDIADNTLFWYTSDNGPQGPLSKGSPGSSGGLRDRKNTLWEGGIRVPAIIEWPQRIPQPRVTSVPANTCDIYPTLLDIADVGVADQPMPLDGISLVPLIDGKMVTRPQPMGFWSNFNSGQGMNSPKLLAALEQSQASGDAAETTLNDSANRQARIADQLKVFAQRGLIGNAAWIDNRYKLHRRWDSATDEAGYELYDLEADATETHDLADDMPDRVASMQQQLEVWQQSVVRSLEGEDYTAENLARPLVRVVDLNLGEAQEVELCDGSIATVKLLELQEAHDTVRGAVRQAEVTVEINGQTIKLVSATYHLPTTVGRVQIDCSITKGYNSNGTPESWNLEKDARLRLWPSGSQWMRPGTFMYPVKQRWFATYTQMANVPVFVDGGERPSRKTKIYYHNGLDIGGAEGMVEVVAATDGLVVSSGLEVLDGHQSDTPVRPRYDVVYVRDARGWYYRYSHLKAIDPAVKIGRVIAMGERIGVIGKEGGSGGWSHLHFGIDSRQPSGKWGTQEGYAFLWEAYLRQYKPELIAVARPHHLVWVGEEAVLDATKSWDAAGRIEQYEWQFHDGTTATGPTVTRTYDKPGQYSEVLKVTNSAGDIDYDFAVVIAIDRQQPEQLRLAIHPVYAPTLGIRTGDPVTFKVRAFNANDGSHETWDFGDGSPAVAVQSNSNVDENGNVDEHAPDGYAVTTHSFEKPGHYVACVQRTNQDGIRAMGHLHVRVGPRPQAVEVAR